ncbi:MAG TPA: aminomethyl-transferring glycine dehydrogenase subunit GcvPB, partial [Hyphomicrobiaceae bacterium]|nr:aminomethyl-transferring glycine dehydrogenase subunit GcvPB [Hyphomicrobiaceae bacterium]
MMKTRGRPAGASTTRMEEATFTGNRGLRIEEPLIFEIGSATKTGVDLPEPKHARSRLGG